MAHNREPRTKAEKFNLILITIGVIADLAGLSTFVATLWNPSGGNLAPQNYVLFIIVASFILFYVWLSVAWMLAKRGLAGQNLNRNVNLWRVALTSTVSVGFLLSPIIFYWVIALLSPIIPPNNGQLVLFSGCLTIVGGAFITFGISYTLRHLMPLIYTDLNVQA